MKKAIASLPALLASTLLGIGLSPLPAGAGPVGENAWRVMPGDTLYGIARRLAPQDRDRQRRLRQAILEANAEIFQGDPNRLPVGVTLRIPTPVPHASPANTRAHAERAPAARSTPPPAARPVSAPAPARPQPARAHAPRPEPPPIGRIIIAAGDVRVERPEPRPLDRKLREGDTIVTGPGATAQIRMKDGALMTLRPGSRLRILRYRYEPQRPQQDEVTLELLKGGLRTLTGLLGKRSRDRYQVRTTMATIGIRGTHYGLRLCQGDCEGREDGLYGAVVDGAIVVRTDRGTFRFGNDEYFHLGGPGGVPRPLLAPPGVIFDADRMLRLARLPARIPTPGQEPAGRILPGEGREPGEKAEHLARRGHPESEEIGHLLPIQRPGLIDADRSQANNASVRRAPYGAVTVVAFNDLYAGVGSDAAAVRDTGGRDNIVLLGQQGDVRNIPVLVRLTERATGEVYGFASGQATLKDVGGHPMGVNWGRWTGPFVITENGRPAAHAGNFHFIQSPNIATPEQLAGLNATFSYTTVGGTPATDHQGNVGLLADAFMTVDFAARAVTAYSVTAPVNGIAYHGEIAAPVPLATAIVDGLPLIDPNGSCPNGNCVGHASLAFVNDLPNGRIAAGAISGYALNDPAGTAGVSGVVFMTRP